MIPNLFDSVNAAAVLCRDRGLKEVYVGMYILNTYFQSKNKFRKLKQKTKNGMHVEAGPCCLCDGTHGRAKNVIMLGWNDSFKSQKDKNALYGRANICSFNTLELLNIVGGVTSL